MSTMAETNTQGGARGTKQEFHLKNNEFSGKGACKTSHGSSSKGGKRSGGGTGGTHYDTVEKKN